MAPVDGPWKDIRSLETLITYWTEHAADFADPKRRQNALTAASLAIKEASGEDISPRQIMTKFWRMWEKRLDEYKHLTGGAKALFDIGPQCLDLHVLHLEAFQGDDSETLQEGVKSSEALVLLPKTRENISESESKPAVQAEIEQIRVLEEQLSLMQKENALLKESVQAKDADIQILRESKHLHEHISSSTMKNRGPEDREVRDRMQVIMNLVRLSTNGFTREYSDEASLIPFLEMKARYSSLYELHQQAYSFDLDDDLTLMRLGALGIPPISKKNDIRALIGMNILQTVFRSSFPDFFHDRGSAALVYEQVIEEQAGPIAKKIFIQSAQHIFIKSPKFADSIVPFKATRLSQMLNELLFPLRDSTTLDDSPQSHDIWESQEQSLRDVFAHSLTLRAELRLNLHRYEFFWPPPTAPFSKVAMSSDNADSNIRSSGLKVLITLFPGIRAWDPESIAARQGNSDLDDDDYGSRVVTKALVITY